MFICCENIQKGIITYKATRKGDIGITTVFEVFRSTILVLSDVAHHANASLYSWIASPQSLSPHVSVCVMC